MKKVVITAIDRDGFEFHFSHICLGVSDDMDKLDVKKAIEKASTEYCKTEEGQKLYKYNNNSFNYGDFDLYVPNEICEKYAANVYS